MKKMLFAIFLIITSMPALSYTTYYSDGSFSQTTVNGNGDSTTYNSNNTFSQTQSNSYGGSTTYNSNGTFSTSDGSNQYSN